MKKRILILVLAIACLFSFAACKKDTAYSLFNEANTKMTEATGVEAKVTVDMKMTGGDENMEQKITMDIKVNGDDMAMVLEMAMEDETMKVPVTYVDGVMYMEQAGMKIKSEVDAEDFGAEYGSMGKVELPEFTEELLKDVKVEKDGDTKFFTVALTKETAMDFLGETALSSIMGGTDEIAIEKFDITFTFTKDNVLTKMAMDMILVPTEDAEDAEGDEKLEATMVYEFKNFGTAPTIEAPADADEYLDMSDMMG